jgi:hypothetical protein
MRSNHPKPHNRPNPSSDRCALAAGGYGADYGSGAGGGSYHTYVMAGISAGGGLR